jgi:hypothetical protein
MELVLSSDRVTIGGVWIGNRNIEHLQNVTRNNYDSLTELHTPKITVFSVCYVFTSRCLVTDLSNVLCFRAQVLTG